jgi:MYXO-CTERM domain-containing protein
MVGLSLASAVDYRETQNVIKYVPCSCACSLTRASTSGSFFALVLPGLAMVGALVSRRRRG